MTLRLARKAETPALNLETRTLTLSQVPPTMMSYLSLNSGDWASMTQLFFDNVSTLLGMLVAVHNMTYFGVPTGIVEKVCI